MAQIHLKVEYQFKLFSVSLVLLGTQGREMKTQEHATLAHTCWKVQYTQWAQLETTQMSIS